MRQRTGLAIVVMLAMLAGCNKQQMATTQAEIAAARIEVRQLAELLAQPVPGVTDQDADQARTRLADALGKADQIIEAGQAVLNAAENEDIGVAIREGGIAVAQYLPNPYSSWVLLATTLIGGIGTILAGRRATRNGNAAKSVGYAVEKAKDDHGLVDFTDETTKRNLRADMGATAAKLVDEGRGRG